MTEAPLSDDEIEMLLHEWMRQIVNTKAESPAGREVLRIAMVGPYGALMRLERLRKEATGQMPGEPQQP